MSRHDLNNQQSDRRCRGRHTSGKYRCECTKRKVPVVSENTSSLLRNIDAGFVNLNSNCVSEARGADSQLLAIVHCLQAFKIRLA